MSAKQILLEMCEQVVTHKLTRLSRNVEGIDVALHRDDYTTGVWTLTELGKPVYCTDDINQCEIMLGRVLSQKSKVGAA